MRRAEEEVSAVSIADIVAKLHAYGVDTTLIEDIVRLVVRPSYDLPKAYAAKLLYDREYRRTHKKKVSYETVAQESLPHTPSKNTTASLSSSQEPLKKEESSGCAREPEVVYPDAEDVELAIDAYTQVAKLHNLPLIRKMTDARKQKLRCRLKDAGNLEGWYEACDKLKTSTFLREIRADFDFMMQQKTFIRLIEGKYDDTKKADIFSTNSGNGYGRHH
jgi:hypothetical protein